MGTFLYTVIIYPLYTVIECIFTLFSKLAHNEGIAIIGVSIGITLFCLPLYAVAEHWQEIERDKEKAMKPQLDRIKKAFSGDERYMMTTTYYRQCRYSPLMALRSSFGLLIQIPFFIAAYTFLSHLPSLRGESFLFIRDMGAQDALFHIGSFPVNVLPIAMTLINCVSGTIYTRGFPLKDKIQVYGMAAIFLVILYPSPSGLVLYWTFNNIFSMVKNIFYKLKNPLKSFWICSCAVLAAASVYVFFFFAAKAKYKAVYAAAVLLVFLLPVLARAAQRLLATVLAPLVQDGRRRTGAYAASCVLLFLLTGLVIPSSLISSSPVEFSNIGSHTNPASFVSVTALQAAGIFFFWAPCVYFLFNAKVQAFFTVLLGCAAYGALANSYIFSPSYGDISPTLSFLNAVDFKSFSLPSLLNIAAILALCAGMPFLATARGSRIFTSASAILALALTAVSAGNVFSINRSYAEFAGNSAEAATRIEPIFHLARNKPNVIVIMLDRAQSQYIPEMLREDPALGEQYGGFVFYNNVLSFNGHTIMGAPPIYGGYEYTPYEMNMRQDVPLREKHNESLLLLPRLFTEEKGFDAVVTDSSWANYSDYFDTSFLKPYPLIRGYQLFGTYSGLWDREHREEGNNMGDSAAILERNLLFFSAFRAAPLCLRELIYQQGAYWNADEGTKDAKQIIDWYSALDYMPQLTDVSDTGEGLYACIVNELTHASIPLQAPDYVPAKAVTDRGTSKYASSGAYATMMAAIKRVGEWLDYLREAGAYDNTRIIIVSDHGCDDTEDDIERDDALDAQVRGTRYTGRGHFHPLLLVKDFGASGPLREDDATFMTNADVPALALRGLVSNPVNPFTGRAIPLDTAPLKEDGVIVSANDRHRPMEHGKYAFSIADDQWWRVKGSIFRADSWSRAEPPAGK